MLELKEFSFLKNSCIVRVLRNLKNLKDGVQVFIYSDSIVTVYLCAVILIFNLQSCILEILELF